MEYDWQFKQLSTHYIDFSLDDTSYHVMLGVFLYSTFISAFKPFLAHCLIVSASGVLPFFCSEVRTNKSSRRLITTENEKGEQEQETVVQNRAYSNNAYPDGVTLNTHKTMYCMVIASEIRSMKDLECYMNLSTLNHPLVHFNLFYQPWHKIATSLVRADMNQNHDIMQAFNKNKVSSAANDGVKKNSVDENQESALEKDSPEILVNKESGIDVIT